MQVKNRWRTRLNQVQITCRSPQTEKWKKPSEYMADQEHLIAELNPQWKRNSFEEEEIEENKLKKSPKGNIC
jgi:hypothetical protein